MWVNRKIVMGLAFGVLTATLPFSTFRSASVCRRCGCRSYAIDFQLPFIPITYWRHRKTEQTLFSGMATELALCQPHSHDWTLIQGGGNGVLCALGNGGNLNRDVRSKEVVAFITNTNRYRDKSEAQKWFEIALDYKDSKALGDWLQFNSFPESGFDSSPEYDKWREDKDKEWPDFVAAARRLWGE